jgi:methionyl-tRNA formyltransferase
MINNKKYFYLVYGIMGLKCLRGLIKENFRPEFVITHRSYELEKMFNDFYKPLEELCNSYDVPLIKTDKISEYKNNFLGFEFGICSGFMEIIGKDILDIPKIGILNLHCGKLPYYRGRAPISRTIIDGKEEITISMHKMDEGVDSGEILFEYDIPIDINDDVNTVYKKCQNKLSEVVINGIEKLYSVKKAENNFTPQDLNLKPKPNKKITEEERKINWDNDIKTIHNRIRGLTFPYPGAFCLYEDNKYYLLKSEIFSEGTCNARQSGEIYFTDDEYVLINCLNGLLKVTEIRDEALKQINPEMVFRIRGIFK